MRTVSLNPLQSKVSITLATYVKIISLLLFASYAVLHFGATAWFVTGLFAVLLLALYERVSKMMTTEKNAHLVHGSIINADGGTFRHAPQTRQKNSSRPVVYDGGMVKQKVTQTNKEG